jgi:carboxyl-terminal processing protease
MRVFLVIFFLLIRISYATNSLTWMIPLRKVITIIQNEYVTKQSDRDLFKLTIEGLLHNIDPYSEYLTQNDLNNIKLHTRGEFHGIGIQLEYKDNKFVIISVADNYPAFKANLKPGDIIQLVNDKSVENYSLSQIFDELEHNKQEVKLTVNRNDKVINFSIAKSLIKLSPVILTVKNDIAYIKISQFNQLTVHALKKSLKYLSRKNIFGIILDLRNNPGGLFEQAIAVSNIFLKSGEIVSTVNYNNNENKKYYAQEKNTINCCTPMVILINRFSASSSEIVAAALKFNNRAILIGEKTFGKGSVQTIIPLENDLGAIKITTSYYRSPNGKIIEKNGIQPDIKVDYKHKQDSSVDDYIEVAINTLYSSRYYK